MGTPSAEGTKAATGALASPTASRKGRLMRLSRRAGAVSGAGSARRGRGRGRRCRAPPARAAPRGPGERPEGRTRQPPRSPRAGSGARSRAGRAPASTRPRWAGPGWGTSCFPSRRTSRASRRAAAAGPRTSSRPRAPGPPRCCAGRAPAARAPVGRSSRGAPRAGSVRATSSGRRLRRGTSGGSGRRGRAAWSSSSGPARRLLRSLENRAGRGLAFEQRGIHALRRAECGHRLLETAEDVERHPQSGLGRRTVRVETDRFAERTERLLGLIGHVKEGGPEPEVAVRVVRVAGDFLAEVLNELRPALEADQLSRQKLAHRIETLRREAELDGAAAGEKALVAGPLFAEPREGARRPPSPQVDM